jgi:hypothetical protein
MKRNITLAGIALILLVAIGITIILGVSKGIPSSVGALQPRLLTLEKLDLEQARLELPLLGESSTELNHAVKSSLKSESKVELKAASKTGLKFTLKAELKDELKSGLKVGLRHELKSDLNSLTASADVLRARPDLANRLLDVASTSGLGDNLHELLLA